MFRQGLRNSVRFARRALPQASLVIGSQRLIAPTICPSTPVIQSWKSISQAVRMYSSEAVAETPIENEATASSTEPVTEFASLRGIGVDQTLLRAIVDDMGYKSMTPVQSKTINPALKGTDM